MKLTGHISITLLGNDRLDMMITGFIV